MVTVGVKGLNFLLYTESQAIMRCDTDAGREAESWSGRAEGEAAAVPGGRSGRCPAYPLHPIRRVLPTSHAAAARTPQAPVKPGATIWTKPAKFRRDV